jgi:uncharacterized protein (DUF924 family)
MHTTAAASLHDILDFWLGNGLTLGWPTYDFSKKWFGGGAELDADIKARFGSRVAEALAGGLDEWEAEPLSRLALIILLDQFTRNVFRGSGKAFEGDARSQKLVTDALRRDWDKQLPLAGRLCLLMPLMHAENLTLQDESVLRFKQLAHDASPERRESLQGNADFAVEHRDIIARFGRFPYRNVAMGRESTAAEETFLISGPRFGQ